MDPVSFDAALVRPPGRGPESGPHITKGRVDAPFHRAQLHRQEGKIPVPEGGYLLAPGATAVIR